MVNKTEIVKKHFDYLSTNYDHFSLKRRNYLNTIESLIKSKIEDVNDIEILDIGCGSGSRLLNIIDGLQVKKVSACDISDEMVKLSKQNGIEDARVSSVQHLVFDDEKYNVVLCLFNVLGYLESDKAIIDSLKEINRVLKKDGYAFIDVMNIWHKGENINFKQSYHKIVFNMIKSQFKLNDTNAKTFSIQVGNDKIDGFVRGISSSRIKKLAKESGFTIDDFKVVGYDSGKIYKSKSKGQFYLVLKKI